MQTTGTVLLNARGVNINGYDCFVNLSKSNKYRSTTCSFIHLFDTPFSGIDVLSGVNNTSSKFSNCSLFYQNYGTAIIDTDSDLIRNVYTFSVWQRLVPIKSDSSINTAYRHCIAQSSVSGLYSDTSFTYSTYYKNCAMADSSNIWHYNDISVNYADGNWHHFACTNSSGQNRLFIDGVKVFDQNITNGMSPSTVILRLDSYNQTKFVDDCVVIIGQALWTSNFAPPTTYLLDSEYAMDLNDVKRRNIIAANVDKKIIIPDEPLKQY